MCIKLRLRQLHERRQWRIRVLHELGPFTRQNMFQLCVGEKHPSPVLHAGPRADGVKCHMVKWHVLLGVFWHCVLGKVSLKNALVGQSIDLILCPQKPPCLWSPLHLHHFVTVTYIIIFWNLPQIQNSNVTTIWDHNVVIVTKNRI